MTPITNSSGKPRQPTIDLARPAEPVPATANGGSYENAVPEPEAVKFDRRRLQDPSGTQIAAAFQSEHQHSQITDTDDAPAGGAADETPALILDTIRTPTQAHADAGGDTL